MKPSSSSPTSLNSPFTHADITPMSPSNTNFGSTPGTSFGLKERCEGADTLSRVAQILHRSKAHLQRMLFQKNAAVVEDFYVNLVDGVSDLIEQIHRKTARLLLHINGGREEAAANTPKQILMKCEMGEGSLLSTHVDEL